MPLKYPLDLRYTGKSIKECVLYDLASPHILGFGGNSRSLMLRAHIKFVLADFPLAHRPPSAVRNVRFWGSLSKIDIRKRIAAASARDTEILHGTNSFLALYSLTYEPKL
jgi:hypothetical protein